MLSGKGEERETREEAFPGSFLPHLLLISSRDGSGYPSHARVMARLLNHDGLANELSCRECNQAAFSDSLSLLSASAGGLAFGICTIERLPHSTCFSLNGLLELKCANTEFAVSCMRVPGR